MNKKKKAPSRGPSLSSSLLWASRKQSQACGPHNPGPRVWVSYCFSF